MHCPRCGQQIISDDMRFCKHCGFALDGVKDLLAPSVPVKDSSPGLLSIRVGADQRSLRGLNQSAYLLLLSFVPIVLAIAQGVFSFTLLPPLLLIKAFYVLLGITALRFGYAIYEAKQAGKSPRKAQVGTSTHELELPKADSSSVTALSAQPANSAEIIQPPSVTEHTTKLLSKSEKEQ
jgi:zinc-ribbon domain